MRAGPLDPRAIGLFNTPKLHSQILNESASKILGVIIIALMTQLSNFICRQYNFIIIIIIK